jgi:LacI family transcriptional regulator
MTINEFAQTIGVSPTTISRTLSGRGRISAQTREMVLARMQELGYTPNLNARRLIEGRSMTVALDWGSASPDSPLDDVYMAQLVEGILRALQRQGYGLLLTPPGGPETLAHWVRGRAVDGVIALGGGTLEEDLGLADSVLNLNAPCVVIGPYPLPVRPRLGSVVIDLSAGIVEVTRHLVEAGHRRIGFLGSRAQDPGLDGLRRALASLGTPLDEALVRIASVEAGAVEQAMAALLGHHSHPTAIIARTDFYALRAMRFARSQGVSVPGDVSIVGHDDIAFAALSEPPLTTIRIDCAKLGEAAATTLLRLLDAPDVSCEPSIYPTRLVPRGTVAPPISCRS